ncbi:MAG: DsbA family protein, partial [Pseudomonadota bacterium]
RADRASAMAVAGELGLDLEQMMRDMADPAVTATIEANLEWARRVGVGGTPAFIIGETLIPGAVPLEDLRAAVAEARGS